MGKGGGLMKKATKTLPGSGANRSGSGTSMALPLATIPAKLIINNYTAPPASLLASKGRPYPLPPSKLRGASPSPSHLGRGAAAAPARGTGLDERDDSAVFGVGAGAGTRGPKGKPLGGFKSSAIVVEDGTSQSGRRVAFLERIGTDANADLLQTMMTTTWSSWRKIWAESKGNRLFRLPSA